VLLTTSIFILVLITILLIAFTPLKVYLPGYTQPKDYHEFRQLSATMDSLDQVITIHQQYIDNFYDVLHGRDTEKEEMVVAINEKIESKEALSNKEVQKRLSTRERIYEEAEMIQEDVIHQNSVRTVSIPLSKRNGTSSLLLLPPTHGIIAERFDPTSGQMGIVIKNLAGTLISATLDGVIIFAGYDPKGGNTVIIQHNNNLLSIYKHCEQLLKTVSQKVKAGEPIAKMGNSGQTDDVNLYFELWYNGIQVNPLDYMVVN
jgi:murein DD-endopeptidase MepM/ murein hydrolase activator NlpD